MALFAGAPADAHARHHRFRDYHVTARHGILVGRRTGMPNYAPPAPVRVGLFGTGLFSGDGLIGLGILGF